MIAQLGKAGLIGSGFSTLRREKAIQLVHENVKVNQFLFRDGITLFL
jgi:hypothetical protein